MVTDSIHDVGDPDGWSSELLAGHVREEYSTYGWALEGMLERAGFQVIAATYSESQIYAAYTCVTA